MRPSRLELEGLTAFREPTVVDFDGVDLFALTGPTGAGKSSVIDALIFALYGSVPRYDDERRVEAFVSQGRAEGRVRLDFTIGADRYTAVRVVRVRNGRATTSEARLERDGEVLAGTASGLDAEVVRLLGLTFQQFTTCVVLPQGQFASFLQAKPAERQGLLVRLLDLGLYDRLREAAHRRAAELGLELTAVSGHLGALAAATPESLAAAQERVVALTRGRDELDAAAPALEAIGQRIREAEAAAATTRGHLLALDDVGVPDGVDEVAALVASARTTLATCDEAERVAAASVEDAVSDERATRERVGDRERLVAWRQARAELARLEERTGELQLALDQARVRLGEAHAAHEKATARMAAESTAYEVAVAAHRAAALRAQLVPGSRCPVCEQVVSEVPHHAEPPELTQRRTRREHAERAAADTAEAARRAELATAKAEERAGAVDAELLIVRRRLDDAPSAAEVDEGLDTLAAAEAAVAERRAALDAAAGERRRQHVALALAEAAERTAWVALDERRDAMAAAVLGPPALGRGDVAAAWATLAAWAAEQRPARRARLDEQLAQAAAGGEERDHLVGRLGRLLGELGLASGAGRHRDVVVDALARAQQEARLLEEALAERERLTVAQSGLARRIEVSKSLEHELHANRFERWVLEHVMRDLCVTATALLHRLSESAYSLMLDDRRGFMVQDHRNADELRLARTLSGGETFLASLSLALALAEQVAQSGAGGAARLESLFLDEGFGTLDAETLDVVAAAIEELGASGRMVGLVSHVPELAERVPVRFEVRRGPRSSTVTRVDR